jgi:hypothetical protein
MKLRFEIFYYCQLGKLTASIEKIRRYCAPHQCPHLGQRKRKNNHGKEVQMIQIVSSQSCQPSAI